ncbi:MAG: glutaredoxin family protein [Deltaproteobacteria bacterium]|nr:glutaredoxin family protein [Deltaproteobacteria bacterium]
MSKLLIKTQFLLVICFTVYVTQLLLVNSTLAHAENNEVILLVIENCSFCDKTEAFLNDKGIPYKRYDIKKDAQGKSLYRQLGGGGVPLMKIGGTIVRGYQPDEIIMALKMRRS